MRIVFVLAALVLLATFAPPALFKAPKVPDAKRIAFEAVPLDPGNPARRRVGALTYLAGWSLMSNDPRFGGISAMHVDRDAVVAVSDAGSLIRFVIANGRAVEVDIRPLPHGPGSPRVKEDRDAEAMTAHGNHFWIGFEQQNAVWRYRRSDWRSDSDAKPEAMARWPGNSGSEGMLRLSDGRFLVFAEGPRQRDGTTEVILFGADPAVPGADARRLRYRAPNGYRLTDAAALPDGRMLLLNRRFSYLEGISAKLAIAAPPDEKTQVIEAREIAHLEPPLTVDNMEALSLTQEKGRVIVWIASDDNFNSLQRTLLLKFVLAG